MMEISMPGTPHIPANHAMEIKRQQRPHTVILSWRFQCPELPTSPPTTPWRFQHQQRPTYGTAIPLAAMEISTPATAHIEHHQALHGGDIKACIGPHRTATLTPTPYQYLSWRYQHQQWPIWTSTLSVCLWYINAHNGPHRTATPSACHWDINDAWMPHIPPQSTRLACHGDINASNILPHHQPDREKSMPTTVHVLSWH
jgi:hypothetical protein